MDNRESAQHELEDADALIYLFFGCPQAGRSSIRLARSAMESLDWSRIQSDFPTYFVSFGNPYVLWELATIRNYVCGYSRQPNLLRAYAQALLGRIPFQGTLPVPMPEQ